MAAAPTPTSTRAHPRRSQRAIARRKDELTGRQTELWDGGGGAGATDKSQVNSSRVTATAEMGGDW